VVLEVLPHAGEVNKWFDTSSAKCFGVTYMKISQKVNFGSEASQASLTNSRTLEDQRRTQSSTTDNNLLPSPINLSLILTRSQRLGRNSLDPHSTTTLHNNLLNLSITNQMQIGMMSTSTVDISMSRIRATSSIAVDPFLPVAGSVSGFQVLEVVGYGDSLGFDGAEEVLHYRVCVVAKTDWIRFVITGCDGGGWKKGKEKKKRKVEILERILGRTYL
jgi:hypothetical protein